MNELAIHLWDKTCTLASIAGLHGVIYEAQLSVKLLTNHAESACLQLSASFQVAMHIANSLSLSSSKQGFWQKSVFHGVIAHHWPQLRIYKTTRSILEERGF